MDANNVNDGTTDDNLTQAAALSLSLSKAKTLKQLRLKRLGSNPYPTSMSQEEYVDKDVVE